MDDYDAKIIEFGFWEEFIVKGKISDDHERNPSESSLVDLESTVFNFRVLLPEIISGKLPSDEKGSPVDWALEHLNDKHGSSYIIDSSLQSF
ncbi:hypothetical protein MRB53_026753 [Persea americana]|uniref:Uncharacterized protein n=1 Tax=Persea americana TaxID=3435 RepID=A0ACC2LIX5_PERAE|nr:hypothetical protein MRB53_026753 [Persea americana]